MTPCRPCLKLVMSSSRRMYGSMSVNHQHEVEKCRSNLEDTLDTISSNLTSTACNDVNTVWSRLPLTLQCAPQQHACLLPYTLIFIHLSQMMRPALKNIDEFNMPQPVAWMPRTAGLKVSQNMSNFLRKYNSVQRLRRARRELGQTERRASGLRPRRPRATL